jgi:putative membrane protein
MLNNAIFATLHFVAVFGIVATLFCEWMTIAATPTYAEARRLQWCDRWYGISAIVVLLVGFARVFYFEKGKEFYLANPFFYAKLGLFLVIGLLSIYPTVRFIKWGTHTKQGLAPMVTDREYRIIKSLLNAQLILLLCMALSASLMARGIGM